MASLLSSRALAGRTVTMQPAAPRTFTPASRSRVVVVEASKVCDLTGKHRNKANAVSFSNKKHRKWQEPNLQWKKLFWAHGQRWVTLRLCTKAIKTVEKNGLDEMAQEAGIDLWKLPFEDARPERLQYLAENKGKVPVAVNERAMKNPEKLAASTKKPRVPVYTIAGKIAYVRPGTEALYTSEASDAIEAAQPEETGPATLKITVQE
jgi:large subunit ribosomal protein L28